MKRIHIETSGDKTAKVYRDSEFGEYRVRLYICGTLHAGADYFTGDKDDAIDTAFAMVRPHSYGAPVTLSKPRLLSPRPNPPGLAPTPEFLKILESLAPQDSPRPTPLSVGFNVAVLHIAGKVLPRGFDVSADAPQGFDSLVAHYAETGRIMVWNGASDRTIFADSQVNFAFRAWHDSRHIVGGFDFTQAGELGVAAMQKANILAIYDGAQAAFYCRLLDAEIMGQFHYFEIHGGFPLDQKGFVVAYLEDQKSALFGDFGLSFTIETPGAAPSDSPYVSGDDIALDKATRAQYESDRRADDTAETAPQPVQGAARYHSRPLA